MINKEQVEQYIKNLQLAIKANPDARMFYFPFDKTRRRAKNLRWGREIGFGLSAYPDAEKIIGSLYGQLIVMFSLDTTGVCIDNKPFVKAVRQGIITGRQAVPRLD